MAGTTEKERAIERWEALRHYRVRRKHRIVAATAATCAAFLLALVLTVHHFQTVGTPQTVAKVPAVPSVQLRGGFCTGQDWEPPVAGGGGGRVTVDTRPVGGVVFWMPEVNSADCRVIVSDLTGNQANSLVDAVRHTRTENATIACPNDTGSAAWVFFRYGGRSALDVLRAELSGCQFASAPHRGSIGPAWQVASILQRLEPPGRPEA